jgi:glycine hydroxymethyltransferase
MTTRGFGAGEAAQVGHYIADVLESKANASAIAKVGEAVNALCARFPVYGPAMHASYGVRSGSDPGQTRVRSGSDPR